MNPHITELDLKNLLSLPRAGRAESEARVARLVENQRRKMEALRLFRPTLLQSPFFHSNASERLVRGGNRSGKSTSAFVEVASAATAIQITDYDGSLIPYKYPKRPLTVWLIGKDEKHIGQTIYRMLFRAGAFRVIRDEVTNEWRAWQPWREYDAANEEKTKEAPPLIPSRLIDPKGWAWNSKADRIFTCCRLVNGTELFAFSSLSEPKMGDPVDIVHIDEDIMYPRHVAEWQARLSDRRGRLIWSAFPWSSNFALQDMSNRAENQKEREKPDVTEIVLKFSDNPFIHSDEKRKRREGWSEEECRARDDGDFMTDAFLIYPNFNKGIHAAPQGRPEEDDEIDQILRRRAGQPPPEWTRYLALDPGHTTCAVLFAAVPPPSYGDAIILYDELYLRGQHANEIAKRVKTKISGHQFEDFIIDFRAGRQTPGGFGKRIRDQYADGFALHGLVSNCSGSHFTNGSDNVLAGIELVRAALAIRPDGRPRIRVYLPNTPALVREFSLYRKKGVGMDLQEDPIARDNHLMDCLRYLISRDPKYVQPNPARSIGSAAFTEFQNWKKDREKQNSDTMFAGAGAP